MAYLQSLSADLLPLTAALPQAMAGALRFSYLNCFSPQRKGIQLGEGLGPDKYQLLTVIAFLLGCSET